MPTAARLLALLLLLLGLAARAQDTAPGELRFEHLTVDQGLSHSDAMAVAQDRAGFIWVGTNHGLDRYDGYELRPYRLPVNADGVSSNRIKVLHVAPATGRLWVGTERSGLSYYDAGTDRLVPLASQPASPGRRPALVGPARRPNHPGADHRRAGQPVGRHGRGRLI